jgi:serine/threonine protein phosphatase 1
MKWLKSSLSAAVAEPPAGGPPLRSGPRIERLVYAIGDVHGRADLLSALLAQIQEDARRLNFGERPLLVLLGDYVDRGPDSRAVLDMLLSLQRSDAFDLIALKGNHEAALLKFLLNADYGPSWVRYGATATLASYGVAGPRLNSDRDGWLQAHSAFVERLPPAHLELLWSLPPMAVIDDYAFVHAGVDPYRPMDEQDEGDMLWIRDPFLQDDTPLEKVVVHGHTPSEQPFSGRRRIGVDTGAYATGVLTAIRLLGASRVFLQARETELS